ncbi:MAG: nucleoside triphosphate hydrolase [Legionellales bacterium]|nr:nucleoside triphosphate hydrolase [Legionellales bacterium]
MNVFEEFKLLEKEADAFGFSWSDPWQILSQIESECQEIKAELNAADNQAKLQNEISDLIHAALSLCVFCHYDPQATLEISLKKFQRRLREVKRLVQQAGLTDLKDQPFNTLMKFWDEAKRNSD